DSAETGNTLGTQVVYDPLQVCRAALCVGLDRSDRLLVAYLFSAEGSCTIGVAELHTSRLCCGERGFSTFANEPSLKLGYRGHLSKQKAAHCTDRHMWQITKNKVHTARHK